VAKNTIIMIGDGMGWEMVRAAAIYQQIKAGATGNTLSDFYTEGQGEGLNIQKLEGYGLVTTYGTTIADDGSTSPDKVGIYNTSNSALQGVRSDRVTGQGEIREGFEFDPTFNSGMSSSGGANVADGVVGNLVGYDPVRGGANPWDEAYYGGDIPEGFDKEYIEYSYPDSANTATTLYTGVKSYNGAMGVDIFEQPVESVLTRAQIEGKSTGLVSSVPVDHATPGAAASNVNDRNKFDEFGVIDTILQQELNIFKPTVILGGGHPLSNLNDPLPAGVEPPQEFEYLSEGTYEELSSNPTDNIYGYTFVERGPDAAQVLADTAASIDPNAGERLLGVYGARGQEGNLPTPSADGDYSTTGFAQFTLGYDSPGSPIGVGDTERPLLAGETDEEFIAKEINENPTLPQLTQAALDVLEDDPDGFWLMVEGGDIDWAAHDNNMDNLIGNTLAFDEAVGVVIDWIEANGGWEENQLIITADHDHYLTLNEDFPELLRTYGPNALTYGVNAQDPDDAADYDASTSDAAGHFWGADSETKHTWTNHSNRPVPVYHQGPVSEILDSSIGEGYEVYGYDIPGIEGKIDQVHIAQAMFTAVTEAEQETFVTGTSESDDLVANDNIDGVQDTIFTGAGNDSVDLVFNTNARNNRVAAGSGEDTIFVSRNDRAFGDSGDDEFYATDAQGNNRMSGGAGNDTFFLGVNDRVLGSDGDDAFYVGEGGDNLLSGGAGADQFWLLTDNIPNSANTVVDFSQGEDVIGIANQGAGVNFDSLTLDGNSIALQGTTFAVLSNFNTTTLTAADFVFL
jgi:alkaline phosphatase